MIKEFVLLIFCISVRSSEILRPRGVAISKASLYSAGVDFTCLDGTLTIPFRYVNDDYCDCPDGTDEPGTAACPNGIFHCTNAGHRSLNIPTSRVNDGICDCCDASDEYLTQNCTDVCNILGEEARIEAQKRAELLKKGSELRQQLIQKGKLLKQEKHEKVITLERDRIEAESVKAEKEAFKTEAEAAENVALQAYREIEEAEKAKKAEEEKKEQEKEAFENFQLVDSNQDGKIVAAELQTRTIFDSNKDGVVSDEEVKFFMGTVEELDWDQFLTDAYPRMKPFFMMEKGLFTPPSTEKPEAEQTEEPRGKEEEEYTPEEQQEEEQDWDEGEEEPQEDKPEEEHDESDPKNDVEKVEEDETKPKYDPETQSLIDAADKARSEFDEAERAVRDVDRELNHLKEGLAKDFGADDEFAALDGECFEYSDREYTYKLCPFDQVSQRPKSGGVETRLGVWSNWVGSDDKYSAMLYDKGQSCWNGPQRSTRVEVSCGLESAVTAAMEPNRCEYLLHFVTPSACRPEEQFESDPHDEL